MYQWGPVVDMVEYAPGMRFPFTYFPLRSTSPDAATNIFLYCRVVRSFTPFTMSAVMEVAFDTQDETMRRPPGDQAVLQELNPAGSSSTYILKLYDRRAAQNVRDVLDDGQAHNAAREASYANHRRDPARVPFEPDDPHPNKDELDRPGEYGVLLEDWLDTECTEMFWRELTVYTHIMQATDWDTTTCPRLHGVVEYNSHLGPFYGLLLERVPSSVTLSRYLAEAAPCGFYAKEVASVCDKAMSALQCFHDAEIVNRDLRPGNILVELDARESGGERQAHLRTHTDALSSLAA